MFLGVYECVCVCVMKRKGEEDVPGVREVATAMCYPPAVKIRSQERVAASGQKRERETEVERER